MKLLSPAPWGYSEDALVYHIKDATGNPVAVVCKNACPRHAEANLLAILAIPDVLEALRKQPAYGEEWKKKLREAYACASGLVEHFLPARNRKK